MRVFHWRSGGLINALSVAFFVGVPFLEEISRLHDGRLEGRRTPYAFGVGITTLNRFRDEDEDEDGYSSINEPDKGDLEPLPLYYVSPLVASNRGEEVKAGWYVVADARKRFEVSLSPLRSGKSVQHTLGKGFDVVLARIQVDGKKTENVDMLFDRTEFEVVHCRGFSESADISGRNRRRKIRCFTYYKATTTSEGVAGVAASRAGQIEVSMLQGKYSGKKTTTRRRRNMPAKKIKARVVKKAPVNEETAIKWGLSVGVSGEGVGEASFDYVSQRKIIKKRKLPEDITTFVRERFWLDTRCIIDLEGNTCRPPIRKQRTKPRVVNLEDPDEPEYISQNYNTGCTNGIAVNNGPDVKKEFVVKGNVFAPGEIICLD